VSEEPGDLVAQRRQKVVDLREDGVDPYRYLFRPTHTATAIHAEHGDTEVIEDSGEVCVAGRMMTRRLHGKTAFAHLRDASGDIQIYVRRDNVGDDVYADFKRLFDLGDIVGVTGTIFRTRTGELTVEVQTVTMVTKALQTLPEKWHGLTDVETRYRQRYVDLIANPEVRETFRKRTRIMQAMRDYLNGREFLEVETPILQPLYGGASARPFTTHHNTLDRTLYLRVSDELYLKRLVVGGLERVYEFCKDFRNEGMDRSHNPEFTLMEVYQAYADYETMMDLVEGLVADAAMAVNGTTQAPFQDETLEFAPPWRRVSMAASIEEATGVDVMALDADGLRDVLTARGVEIEDHTTSWGLLVAELFDTAVESTLIQPTIIYDYPIETSPLAKKKRNDDRFVERFEPFVMGMEVGNAYTELNDPDDQRARFEEQSALREAGDEEAQVLDEDFVCALEYGMPPTGGLGVGIDRIVMLLTDSPNIRDVILFPQMRT
jgi:lysyl-tRNA synthetase, class II